MSDLIYNDERAKRERRHLSADEMYERLAGLPEVSAGQLEAGLAGDLGGDMNKRYGEIILANGLWAGALEMAFHKDMRVAFRASWALEWAYFRNRELFRPYTDLFLRNFMTATNPSVHRHYTKMLCDMMRRGIIAFSDDEAEQVAERAFDLLIDPNTKIAVKVWAGEILFDLSPRLPWVDEHLPDVIKHQIEAHPTPGMINHGNKLLKRIVEREGK